MLLEKKTHIFYCVHTAKTNPCLLWDWLTWDRPCLLTQRYLESMYEHETGANLVLVVCIACVEGTFLGKWWTEIAVQFFNALQIDFCSTMCDVHMKYVFEKVIITAKKVAQIDINICQYLFIKTMIFLFSC